MAGSPSEAMTWAETLGVQGQGCLAAVGVRGGPTLVLTTAALEVGLIHTDGAGNRVDRRGDNWKVAARRDPVHHCAEAPLLTAVTAAGPGTLWSGLSRKNGVANTIIRRAGVLATPPRLSSGRLRATWLARHRR